MTASQLSGLSYHSTFVTIAVNSSVGLGQHTLSRRDTRDIREEFAIGKPPEAARCGQKQQDFDKIYQLLVKVENLENETKEQVARTEQQVTMNEQQVARIEQQVARIEQWKIEIQRLNAIGPLATTITGPHDANMSCTCSIS